METNGHAFRNASSAQAWLDCAQWPIFKKWHIDNEVPIPEGDMSHAERGTKLHDIIETLLKKMLKDPSIDPEKLLRAPLVTKLDEHDEMQMGIAFRAALEVMHNFGWPDHDCTVGLEVPVTLSHEPDSKGKIDLLLVSKSIIGVYDHKFGKGEVLASSFQNKIYAMNVLKGLRARGWDKLVMVELGIIQPELSEKAIIETITPDELDKFRHYVEVTVERQLDGTESRAASHPETCTFCPFKLRCETNKRMILEVMDVAEEVTAETVFPDTLEKFYRAKKMIENALSMARDAIYADSDTFASFGRTERRNPRGFDFDKASEDEIAHFLRINYDVREPYKLKSVAQLMKLMPADADLDQFLLPQGFAQVLLAKPKKS